MSLKVCNLNVTYIKFGKWNFWLIYKSKKKNTFSKLTRFQYVKVSISYSQMYWISYFAKTIYLILDCITCNNNMGLSNYTLYYILQWMEIKCSFLVVLLQKDVEVRRHRGNFSFRWISYYICSRILIHQPILQYVDAANFSVFYVCFTVHLLHIQYINYIVMYFL